MAFGGQRQLPENPSECCNHNKFLLKIYLLYFNCLCFFNGAGSYNLFAVACIHGNLHFLCTFFVIDVNLLWLSEFLEKTHDNDFYFIQIRICHFPVVLAFLKFSFLCKKVDNKITTPLWHCCISHIHYTVTLIHAFLTKYLEMWNFLFP